MTRTTYGAIDDVSFPDLRRRTTRCSMVMVAIGCSVAFGAAVAAVSGSLRRSSMTNLDSFQEIDNTSQQHRGASKSSTLGPLAFTVSNFYHKRDGRPAQEYPWLKDLKLIEPYRETTLAVVDPQPGLQYRWDIRSGRESEALPYITASGAEVVVVFKHLHEGIITLEEVDTQSALPRRRLDEEVMVKYVRREIRTLTNDEREELLDAMFQLWDARVDSGGGNKLYGETYADIWAINRLHFQATVAMECDRFHDGLGFLSSHLMITNIFEYSLQLVNPKLTVPYWDFTIETSSWNTELYDVLRPTSRSPLLQPSWFGTYDEDDYVVKDGRWAFTRVPQMKTDHPGYIDTDVYGRLRVPWNVNQRPYLVRGLDALCQANMEELFPWPTCEVHYNLVKDCSDFYSWSWTVQHDPHGPVHAFLGGMIDCKEKYNAIGDLVGEVIARKMAYSSVSSIKELYRNGIFKCKETVDESVAPDEVFSNGTCGCLDYDLTAGDDYKTVLASLTGVPSLIEGFEPSIQRRVVDIICNTVVVEGDHQQASSSLDPTFWPIHPTIDRLWQFSVLTESVTDYHWPDADFTFTAPDGTNTTKSISLWSPTCKGHGGSDIFPFDMSESGIKDFNVRTGIRWDMIGEDMDTLTNRRALSAFDPRINALTYVYDTFKWEHCEADGFDFDDAWGDTATMSRSSVFKRS